MSNLGDYQVLTTLAKKVGGPKKLLVAIIGVSAGVGFATIRLVEVGVKRVIKAVRGKIAEHNDKLKFDWITVITDVKNDTGFELHKGDKYRVLNSDGNAIMIEKANDGKNPYFVSAEFLRSISDFDGGATQ